MFHNEFSLLKVFSPKIIEQHNFKLELIENFSWKVLSESFPERHPHFEILFSSPVYPSAFVIDSGLFWAAK